jgi:hypothetical protein
MNLPSRHRPQSAAALAKILFAFCVLALGGGAVNAADKPPNPREAEYRNFVLSGSIVGATHLDVLVLDSRGEPLNGALYELKDGALRASIALPLGFQAQVQLKALGAKGEVVGEGGGVANFESAAVGASYFTVGARNADPRGTIFISALAVEIVGVDTGEPGRMRYELRAQDADGRAVPLSSKDVSWDVRFPDVANYLPCEGGAPCIEFHVPVGAEKLVTRPQVYACLPTQFCVIDTGPAPSQPLNGYQAITAGRNHACALTLDARIFCWGSNFRGALGRPTTTFCRTPGSLGAGPCDPVPREITCPANSACRYLAVDAGLEHTCALDVNRKIWCWGNNANEKLGLSCASMGKGSGCSSQMPQPAGVSTIGEKGARFVALSAGHDHTCALSSHGSVYCWGNNNFSQLSGSGTGPRRVASLSSYKQVVAADEHTCAVTLGGELECWGTNNNNLIRPAFTQEFFVDPISVRPFHPGLVGAIDAVSLDRVRTCAHADVSGVVCWGAGIQGDRNVFAGPVTELEQGIIIPNANSNRDSLCALSSGRVLCGPSALNLTQVLGTGPGFRDTTIGEFLSCAVNYSNEAFCWGADNLFGQLGDGTLAPHFDARRVLGP